MYNNVQTSPNRIRNWLINGHNINHSYPQEQSPFDYRQSFDSYDANFNPFSIRQNNFFNFAPQMFHGAANNLDSHLRFNNSWGAQRYPLNPFQSPLINPMLSLASLWRNSFNPRGFFNHFNNLSSGRWMQVNPSNYQATNNLNYNNYFSNTNTSKYTPKTKSKSSKTYSSFSNKKSSGKPTKKTQSKGVVTKQQVKKKPQPNKQTNKQRSIIVHQNTTKTKTKPKKQIPVVGSNAQLIPATKKQPIKKQNPIKQTINQNQSKPQKIKQQPKLAYVLKAKAINKNISSPHAQKRMMASAYIAQSYIQAYDDFLAKNPDTSKNIKDIIQQKTASIKEQFKKVETQILEEKAKYLKARAADNKGTNTTSRTDFKNKWELKDKHWYKFTSVTEDRFNQKIIKDLHQEILGESINEHDLALLIEKFQRDPEQAFKDLNKKLKQEIKDHGIKALLHFSYENWGDQNIPLNKNTRSLDLNPDNIVNNIDEIVDIDKLLPLKDQLKTLKLNHRSTINLDSISEFKELRELNIERGYISITREPNVLPQGIEELKNLEKLNLKGYGQANITAITKLTQLKELDLSNNKYLKDLDGLKNLQELRVLKLGEIYQNQDQVIEDIISLKNLEELEINFYCLSGENQEKLAKALGSRLKRLTVSEIHSDKLKPLSKFTELESLRFGKFINSSDENQYSMTNCISSAEKLKILQSMTKLKELNFGHSISLAINYNEINKYLPRSLELISLSGAAVENKKLAKWKIPDHIKVLDLRKTSLAIQEEMGHRHDTYILKQEGKFKNLEEHGATVLYKPQQKWYHK